MYDEMKVYWKLTEGAMKLSLHDATFQETCSTVKVIMLHLHETSQHLFLALLCLPYSDDNRNGGVF